MPPHSFIRVPSELRSGAEGSPSQSEEKRLTRLEAQRNLRTRLHVTGRRLGGLTSVLYLVRFCYDHPIHLKHFHIILVMLYSKISFLCLRILQTYKIMNYFEFVQMRLESSFYVPPNDQ